MASVYSTRLAAGTITAGTTDHVYTVPSGVTVVVRDFTCGAQSAPANSIAFNLSGVAELFSPENVNQFRTAHEEGRWVLNPGDVIDVDAIAGNWSYCISGYVLD
jgi:hypothetical protein